MKRSVRLAFALLLAATTVFFSCNNPTSSESDPAGSQRGVKGQISGIVIDGSTGLPLSGVKVEIGGKSATTDNAGYYVVSNVLPNDGDLTKGYSVSFYKSGYTAAQDANIQVDPKEYLKTDPFLEQQVLLKMEDYFNTWLTQTYGNGTKIIQGTASGTISINGAAAVAIDGAPNAASFWGTVNDSGDIVGGSIKGSTGALATLFTATVTNGNINTGGITISGTSTGATPGTVTEGTINIAVTSVTSSAGGNWTYTGGVYINDETGTAVQVTSDPKNPEVPKFDLKPLDYLYYYGQSLETVYLYPMNASITGKILVFHNNAEAPVGVPDIKIEFSNVPDPVVGETIYTGTVAGNVTVTVGGGTPTTATIGTSTFVGQYNAPTAFVSGTIHGLIGTDPYNGTVSGTLPSGLTFIGNRPSDNAVLTNATLTIATPTVQVVTSENQGRFYGEGKTDKNGEFTVTGVPAGQALYIQIPGFTDSVGRYYSGDVLHSVNGTSWSGFSKGPYYSQRQASIALPTIYLKADADIALITGTELGIPNDRLEITDPLVVTFSKTMDTSSFSATFTPATGAKGGGVINLIAEWAPAGEGKDAIPDAKVTLTPNNVKMPGYSESGILPYWNGSAINLYTGELTFGTSTTQAKALDGSILIDPITADVPRLPVFTKVGLVLESVQIIDAATSAASGARSILQQGGEIRLTFNKEVAETDGTRFVIGTLPSGPWFPQAWKVDTDEKIIRVFNDRPITGNQLLATIFNYPVVGKGDQINDSVEIDGTLITGLASYSPNLEVLSVLRNPYIEKADPSIQDKLNGEKIATNIKVGVANDDWPPEKPIVLEFSQALNAAPTVSILYSSAPGQYGTAITVTALPVSDRPLGTAYEIPLIAIDRLLAPEQTYYLVISATTGTLPLRIDPRLTDEIGTNGRGSDIQITTEVENTARFAALDATASTVLSGITFNDPPLYTTLWPDAVFDKLTYSVTTGATVPRPFKVYVTPIDPATTVPQWTHVDADFTIQIGTATNAPIPAFTVPDGAFQIMYRGINADGRVYRATVATTPAIITAAVTGTSITGVKGTLITSSYWTITLGNDYFQVPLNAGDPVDGWFTNLPVGLTANIAGPVNAGEGTATVVISGKPEAILATTAATVVIPQGITKVGERIVGTFGTALNYNVTNPSLPGVTVNVPTAITGTLGKLIDPQYLTITLNDDTFNTFAEGAPATGWFTNLPAGLVAEVASPLVGGTSITAIIKITGTPTGTAANTAAGEVLLPATATTKGTRPHVNFSGTGTNYAIAAALTAIVNVSGGPTIPSSSQTTGTAMPTQYLTFTITGTATFNPLVVDTPVNWINLPVGLTASTAYAIHDNDTSAIIKITGIPTEVRNGSGSPILAVIPASATTRGDALGMNSGLSNYVITAPSAASSVLSGTFPISTATGETGAVITANPIITITLTGGTFTNVTLNQVVQSNVTGNVTVLADRWITNLPAGLTVVARSAAGANTIDLEVVGTPTGPSDQLVELKVPLSKNSSKIEVRVSLNTSIGFDIAPAP